MPLLLPNFMQDFGRVERVSTGGSHACACATSYHRLDRPDAKFLWFWPWFSRDEMAWSFRNYSVVTCWGYNDHGQLGLGFVTDADALDSYYRTPDEVPQFSVSAANQQVSQRSMMLPDDKVVHLATGHCHTCALTLLGSLFCWGCNTFGQVGSPLHCSDKDSCASPAAVSFSHMNITSTISISAAADNTCAIAAPRHVVVCWGRNNHQQLGRSTAAPGPFEPPLRIKLIAQMIDEAHECHMSFNTNDYKLKNT
jgi:alpha-tubulin suppressor-like RCC1 family protein